jgi:anti-sigma regulatory factor (Ser/Thr protein kinase)
VLTLAARPGLVALSHVRRAFARAAAQRPAAVVLDLAGMPVRWAAMATMAGLSAPHHGVRRLVCAPSPVFRALRVMPGVTACSSSDRALATLPGYQVSPANRVCAHLPPTVAAPRTARALVGDAASAWHVHHLAPAAQLIASELVSNSVEHAGTAVDLHVTRMRNGLCIAVHDRDPRPVAPVDRPALAAGPVDPLPVRGRGLSLVARTAQRWGCLTGTADKVVWAALVTP